MICFRPARRFGPNATCYSKPDTPSRGTSVRRAASGPLYLLNLSGNLHVQRREIKPHVETNDAKLQENLDLSPVAIRSVTGKVSAPENSRMNNRSQALQFSFHDQTIRVNIPDRAALEHALQARLGARHGFALATVNLDHLVKMRGSPEFTRVYAGQDYVVADGRPIVALSRLAQRPVKLLPGSDLVLPLCRMAAAAGAKVALVGSTETALEDAREVLCAQVPGLVVSLCISPSVPFDPDGTEAAAILQRLESEGIGLCLLALGAPRQEALALRGRELAPGVGFASIGAGLDFLGGHQQRAPLWMRRMGLEWLWRALSSPRRLIPRYVACAAILPGEVARARRLR